MKYTNMNQTSQTEFVCSFGNQNNNHFFLRLIYKKFFNSLGKSLKNQGLMTYKLYEKQVNQGRSFKT